MILFMLETWFFYLLLSAILYALSTVLDKKLMLLNLSPSETSTLKMCLDAANVFIILLLFRKIILPSPSRLWVLIAFVAFFWALAIVFYFDSLKFSDVTKAAPFLTASNVTVSFIGGAMLFSEAVSAINILGIILIITGSFVVLFDGKPELPKDLGAIKYMFFSGAAGAISGLIAKQSILMIDPLNLALFMYILVTLYLIIYNFIHNYEKQVNTIKTVIQNRKILVTLYASTLFASLGTVFYFSALSLGDASRVIPGQISIYTLFVLFISKKTFDEKHFNQRLVGSLILISGLYGLFI